MNLARSTYYYRPKGRCKNDEARPIRNSSDYRRTVRSVFLPFAVVLPLKI